MEVRDYSQKLSEARNKYSDAQNELRESYEKDTKNLQAVAENKLKKVSKNYGEQKSKLEEQNKVSNELYSDKTKEAVSARAERFRNDMRKSTDKFEHDSNKMKEDFTEKLSNISDSYKKSTEENDRYHSQALKAMGDRYTRNNKNYKDSFEQQLDHLQDKNKKDYENLKESEHIKQVAQGREKQMELEEMRAANQESKFREVSRLRNDNSNLRTSYAQERDALAQQQESRIDEALKVKQKETMENKEAFTDLQRNIRAKEQADQEKMKEAHLAESKSLQKKFQDDLRNVQRVTDSKLKGGNEVSTLKDENNNLIKGYEKRITSAREDAKKDMEASVEKEENIDNMYRDKIKNMKIAHIEDMDRHEVESSNQYKKGIQSLKDKTDDAIDRYKTEAVRNRNEGEAKLVKSDNTSKAQLKNQRVEFGKYINDVNNKKLEEISSIKDSFTKDKTEFMQKTHKDMSDEKLTMKESFNHTMSVKEDLYEKKLEAMEREANKIIENYEAKMSAVARQAEKEIEMTKSTEEARRQKENQAIKIAFESAEREHEIEMTGIRAKYETMIGRDRAVNELQTNRLVQKYEDQLERERAESAKTTNMKLSEAQAQLERQVKSSELEKEAIRVQFEQRIEQLKNSALLSNSKKA